MDDDVLSASGGSLSDDADEMNDVTQPHALEERMIRKMKNRYIYV